MVDLADTVLLAFVPFTVESITEQAQLGVTLCVMNFRSPMRMQTWQSGYEDKRWRVGRKEDAIVALAWVKDG